MRPAPTGLNASAVSSSQIDLTWTDNADNETEFRVYEKIQTLGGKWRLEAILPANSVAFSDTGLLSGTGYCYRVAARNGVAATAYSNIACTITP